MAIFFGILNWLLDIYFYLLLARFVLELMLGVNRAFSPKGIWLVLAEIVMTVTDPPLKLVRRFVKPVRMGTAGIDFSWTIVLFVVAILRAFLGTFG